MEWTFIAPTQEGAEVHYAPSLSLFPCPECVVPQSPSDPHLNMVYPKAAHDITLPFIHSWLCLCSISCKAFTPFSTSVVFSCSTPKTYSVVFLKANWGTAVGLGFLERFQWKSAGASGVQTEPQTGKWESVVVWWFKIPHTWNNNQTTWAIVIVSVKCVPTLREIYSRCSEACDLWVCNQKTVYVYC